MCVCTCALHVYLGVCLSVCAYASMYVSVLFVCECMCVYALSGIFIDVNFKRELIKKVDSPGFPQTHCLSALFDGD